MSPNTLPDADTVAIPEIPVADAVELSPDNTALIVVDMQKDFVHADGALAVEAAAATVPAMADLIARARDHQVPLIYTQDTHRPGDREFSIWPPHCLEGSDGWEIVDDLAPQKGDHIIQKRRYDGFYGTSLEHLLAYELQIENVIIVGTVANICVGQTAASAGLRWYNVITAANGISALTEFDQAAALRQISMLYNGTVVAAIDGIDFG